MKQRFFPYRIIIDKRSFFMSNKNNRKDYLYGDFGIKKCKENI